MGIASEIGGAPELAAVFVIVSGVFGAMLGWPLLSRLRLGQDVVYGLPLAWPRMALAQPGRFSVQTLLGRFLVWRWA